MNRTLKTLVLLSFVFFAAASCNIFKRSTKEGCPTNGKNVGAERLLSGEKVKKARRFKN